jgi:hypothetical protein
MIYSHFNYSFIHSVSSVVSDTLIELTPKLNPYYIQWLPWNLVKWVPCCHGMARPRVADGGDGLQIWRVAANILNKQSRTADKGWPLNLALGGG